MSTLKLEKVATPATAGTAGFGLTIDPGTPGATVQPSVAQLLCGVTGTEFLSVNLGTDALEFLPGSAAWKIPADLLVRPYKLESAA